MHLFADIVRYEPYVRAGCFLVVLITVGFFETVRPRLKPTVPKRVRSLNNLLMHFVNSLALRLIFPVLPIGAAALCAEKGWGLLNYTVPPPWISLLFGIACLDLTIYLQHAGFHRIPVFWRLHMVHHMDLDIDVTTGVRFHPVEIILSGLVKIFVIVIVGPPVAAVLIFEILLNGMSLFNHGNIHLPERMDKFLRLFVVTPDMHRVHHSVIRDENNRNFGFNIPWWDMLFRTYLAQPSAGHEGMSIGLTGFRDVKYSTLPIMLAAPFMTAKRLTRG